MSDNNKCALEILEKNDFIETKKDSHAFFVDNEIDFIYIKFYENNPKFNKKLREELKSKYVSSYTGGGSGYTSYVYIEKAKIREWINNLPEEEELRFNRWDIAFEDFVKKEIESSHPDLSCYYNSRGLFIKNLKVMEERKRKENEKEQEGLDLLDKLF